MSNRGRQGHNSFAADVLRTVVERVERLQDEKQGLSQDIKDVFAEAKGNGLDPKIIRNVIKLRKEDMTERAENMALLKVYCEALGLADPFS